MKGKNMDLEKLLEWLKKYDLTELTVKDGGFQVTLKKETQKAVFPHQPLIGIDEAAVTAEPANCKIGSLQKNESSVHDEKQILTKTTQVNRNLHELKSPLVGTFYRAPAPDAEPFVEEGDLVEINDKLCIVEAMKIMNEIESPVKGIVREICPKNNTSVEYGQVLFRIEEQAAHS